MYCQACVAGDETEKTHLVSLTDEQFITLLLVLSKSGMANERVDNLYTGITSCHVNLQRVYIISHNFSKTN